MKKLVLAALVAAATVSGAPAAHAECDPWNPLNPQCWCQINDEETCTMVSFESLCRALGVACESFQLEGIIPAG